MSMKRDIAVKHTSFLYKEGSVAAIWIRKMKENYEL